MMRVWAVVVLQRPTPTLSLRISCCHGDEQHLYDLSARPPCPLSHGEWTLIGRLVCVVWTALPLYEVLVGVKGVQRAEPPPV